MNPEKLKVVLADHKNWLSGDGGKRANLRCANLRCANLRGADLSYADLRGCNLSGCDLRDCDVRYADLRYANLSDTKGFLLLPVQDMRGYCFTHAVLCDDEWRIRAGCRDFSIREALEHWGSEDYPDRERGDMYVYAVRWLQEKVAR